MNAAAEVSRGVEPGEPAPAESLSETDCWSLTRRIAGSEHFSKSEFLPKFLLYICDRELRGATEGITEQQIGVQVFNRPAGYNPGDDNIVRNYAGQLRKRLDLYFAGEGASERIRITIPRGAYVPVFRIQEPVPELVPERIPEQIQATPIPSVASPLPENPASPQSNRGETAAAIVERETVASTSPIHRAPDWKMFLLGAGVCSLLLCVAFLLSNRFHPLAAQKQSPVSPLWSTMFSKDRDTFIVPADSGLGILQNLTEQQASLADYISGKYLSDVSSHSIDSSNLDDLRTQRYTSIADVNIIAKISRLPEVVPNRAVIRFARDLRMEDLQDGNAILLGAIHTDPWVDLLQKQLNFQFVCQSLVNHCSIINSHPAPAEKVAYENESQQLSHKTFGVVAFIPNLNRTGKILLIEGLNMAATQAAADTVMDEARMRPIIQRATLPDGTIGPFELLIETTSVDAAALPSRIVASRYQH